MIKTLTKHGNSYALVIDKPLMEILRITPDTPLEMHDRRPLPRLVASANQEGRGEISGGAGFGSQAVRHAR